MKKEKVQANKLENQLIAFISDEVMIKQ